MKIYWATLISSFFLFFLPGAHALHLQKIVIFGDSLSDNGNLYMATSAAAWTAAQLCERFNIGCDTQPPVIPKSPPYYEGRFSNGPVWIEYVAQQLNLTQSVTQFSDFAYGGAFAASGDPIESVSNIDLQVQTYLNLYRYEKGKVDRYLFVIWAGGNDYLNAPRDSETTTTLVVNAIQTEIHELIRFGAKQFLILNLPDLGLTPFSRAQGPLFTQHVSELIALHNQKLQAMLTQESKDHTGVQFIGLDILQYSNELFTHADQYQFTNIKDPCYAGNFSLQAPAAVTPKENISLKEAQLTANLTAADFPICNDPDHYFYWDRVHPTRVVHQLLAQYALTTLKEKGVY